MRKIFTIAAIFGLAALAAALAPPSASAGQCYVNGRGFAVLMPNAVERACFLYTHEVREYKPYIESGMVVTQPRIDLHPDTLHMEFLALQAESKVIVLRKGTPIFACRNDLETQKKDEEFASLVAGKPPEFNCRGVLSKWVPVRVVNMSTCYWIALEDVQCEEETPHSLTFQHRDQPTWQEQQE